MSYGHSWQGTLTWMPVRMGLRGFIIASVLAVLIGASLGAQDTPEQYPGQHTHATPPDDWFCVGGKDAPPDHKCACANMPKDDKDPICAVYENVDDAQCSSFCHKEHCACKSSCPDRLHAK